MNSKPLAMKESTTPGVGGGGPPPQLLFPSSLSSGSAASDVSKPMVTGNFINQNNSNSNNNGNGGEAISLAGVTYSKGENIIGDDSSDDEEEEEEEEEVVVIGDGGGVNQIMEKLTINEMDNGRAMEKSAINELDMENFAINKTDSQKFAPNAEEKLQETLDPLVSIPVSDHRKGLVELDDSKMSDNVDGNSNVMADGNTILKVEDKGKEKIEQTNDEVTIEEDKDKDKVEQLQTIRKSSITTESKEYIINRVQVPLKSKEDLELQKQRIQETKLKNDHDRTKLNKKDPNNLPFDFQRFLTYLKSKSAESIVKYLKSFMIAFSKKNWQISEQVKLINDFKNFIYDKMAGVVPFVNMKETEFINCQEGMEKLIMNRLYDQVFSPVIQGDKLTNSHREDNKKDELLTNQVLRFSWITNRHLDLEDGFIMAGETFVQMAIAELIKINNYRSPRDKIICILNCCKVIFAMLKNSCKPTSADDFIPTLIYVVLKTDEDLRLNSNVSYIERFRNEDGLAGEVSYYLSSFWAVIGFIENLNKESLSITQEEWDSHMRPFEETNKNELADLELSKQNKPTKNTDSEPKKTNEPAVNGGSLIDPEAVKNSLSPSSIPISQIFSPFQSIQSFFQNVTDDNSSPNKSFLDEVSDANSPGNRPVIKTTTTTTTKSSTQETDHRDSQLAQSQKKSQEEYLAKQAFEKQVLELTEQLQGMFPLLDKEIIKDIVIMNKARVTECVDVCLNLTGAT
ncbi:guanine nucleotide exchange factor [Saccharomycopsis crataegensis]|uniref:Guanine nucleotide exchange factor n=1 Tax=Saccharomycopsis crataegensis TaxID=43959 RepID=A0AAV5QVL3_9ASCO|nr:guanine nucleotide exchange factor [Saccharomycopsis crataegensis]